MNESERLINYKDTIIERLQKLQRVLNELNDVSYNAFREEITDIIDFGNNIHQEYQNIKQREKVGIIYLIFRNFIDKGEFDVDGFLDGITNLNVVIELTLTRLIKDLSGENEGKQTFDVDEIQEKLNVEDEKDFMFLVILLAIINIVHPLFQEKQNDPT